MCVDTVQLHEAFEGRSRDKSPARLVAEVFASLGEDIAHKALDAVLNQFSAVELCALWHDHERFWARRSQIIPRQRPGAPRFSSWGFQTGRGFGKTWAIASFIVDEVLAGRATSIGLCAQTADDAEEIMIHNPRSGLIAMSPPGMKPVYNTERRVLIWPNGATATVFTPKKPGKARGPEHHIVWCTEFVAWPRSTADETLSNLELGLRLGYALLLWDSTPKRKHPIIKERRGLRDAKPHRHKIVHGHSRENIDNINKEKLEELEAKLKGTRREREELHGEYLDDDDGTLWDVTWIDDNRRDEPDDVLRRLLAIDPAISQRATSDETGFVELALGNNGHAYVLGDRSGKHDWDSWGRQAVERYLALRCDCIMIERNRGGDGCAANIRTWAREYCHQHDGDCGCHDKPVKLRVEIVKLDAKTRHVPGVIYVKEINSQTSKGTRAEPVAVSYKHGKVHHVNGADLEELEEQMDTWEPGETKDSPDQIDALVFGVWELLDLSEVVVDLSEGFQGLSQVGATMRKRRGNITGAAAAITGRGSRGRRGRWGSRI